MWNAATKRLQLLYYLTSANFLIHGSVVCAMIYGCFTVVSWCCAVSFDVFVSTSSAGGRNHLGAGSRLDGTNVLVKNNVPRVYLTAVCGSVSGDGKALRFTGDQDGRAHATLAVLYSKRGVVECLILVYKPGDASRLDPAHKQPAWDGAAGLVQHRPSCSVVLRTRRRRSHARMGASSDIGIRIHLRVSTRAARI